MVLGDGRSLKILPRYIGTASVTGRMRRDLARALGGEGRTNPTELVQTARRELMPESRSARLATKIWQKDEFDGHHRVDASADSRARSTRKWLEKRSDFVVGRTATRTGEPPHTPALVSQRCPHRCVISGAGVACSGDCGHRRQHLGRCLCPACFNDEAADPWWPAHRPVTSASDFVVGRTSAGETTAPFFCPTAGMWLTRAGDSSPMSAPVLTPEGVMSELVSEPDHRRTSSPASSQLLDPTKKFFESGKMAEIPALAMHLVEKKRRDFVWHTVEAPSGPSTYWRTHCGVIFTAAYALRLLCEKPANEPLCRRCIKA